MSNTNIEPITLERILDKGNLRNAFKKVINNKGSAGVDEMETRDLKDYFLDHPNEISESVRNGSYRPKPILRTYCYCSQIMTKIFSPILSHGIPSTLSITS